MVRTNATLAQAADRAPRLQPHLFADAAYHHTLSLGPLVIPGQTACVACLAGRIGHRWGDPDPPAAPLAARRLGLLAGWIAAELENVASGSSTLANRTVSMDIASHRMIYPLEVFCLATGVEGEMNSKILCYNPDRHSVSVVGECPPWEECAEAINNPIEGRPQVVFIFILLLEEMLAKFGPRGGRFALIEVGHAAHSLALRLASVKLVGFELGELLDREILRLLGLQDRPARVALGYACGLP